NARMSGVNPAQLGVIARTTAAQYRNAHKTAEQIGRELHVDYLLEGTVRRDGERERVFLWLVRTRDQVPVWAETYDRGSKDTLAAEDGISSHVTAVLGAKFFGKSATVAEEPAPANPAAHEDYLKGRYFWEHLASTDLEKALTLFQSAIEKDPSYAEAYAGVAETYAVLADWTLRSPAETLPAAREAAKRALEHDSSLSEARAVLGLVAWQFDHDWSQAEAEFSQALRLSPTSAIARQWHGEYLAALGRFPEAYSEMERARQLDPLSRFISTDVGYTAYLGRDYDRAIAAFRRTTELDPDFYAAHVYLYWTYMQKKKGQDVVAENLRLLEFNHSAPEVVDSFRKATAGGDIQSINRWLLDRALKRRQGRYGSAWRIAACYAALGEKDLAFQWMDKAMEEHDPEMARLRVDPMMDPLRDDPRFPRYLDRLNLR
ncbi:MAG TPA: tetratricopeptide repeat protein, partial [Candidatus Acidoferrales bacterium]|nr:tetratricopeptide repeat protein [Candidatus Acidoferrales bacterium]